jgi:hypothetical protein
LITAAADIAVPGDRTNLGFINRGSLVDAFNELKGYVVTDGYKTEDERGYTISASAKMDGKTYCVRAWVSRDWTKGRIISIIPD